LIAAYAYAGSHDTTFSIVRYGNVAGSRGSVIPYFRMLLDKGETDLPITDVRMTRFWITLDEAVELVLKALDESKGGETYISKIPSFKIADLAEAMTENAPSRVVGIREGEKLHEVMVTEYDSFYTYEYEHHYIIYPNFDWWNLDRHFTPGGRKVDEFFRYASDNNCAWLSVEDIRERLKNLATEY
jgi:FlaA1/EpsC-like NDP-sugar epimerase